MAIYALIYVGLAVAVFISATKYYFTSELEGWKDTDKKYGHIYPIDLKRTSRDAIFVGASSAIFWPILLVVVIFWHVVLFSCKMFKEFTHKIKQRRLGN